MKIILLKDVKKVGQRGTVAEVADGYAQNVLLPQKLALPATAQNMKTFEKQKAQIVDRHTMNAALAKKALDDLQGATILITVKANDTGVLFDSIHELQIAKAIEEQRNIVFPPSAFILDAPLKNVGEFTIPVAVHGVKGSVTVKISA